MYKTIYKKIIRGHNSKPNLGKFFLQEPPRPTNGDKPERCGWGGEDGRVKAMKPDPSLYDDAPFCM